MYYLSFDGEGRLPISPNLSVATDVFEESVQENDWCPALVDDEGVVLISFDNSSYDNEDYGVIIGPKVDRDWGRDYGGYDRIAEEHDYKFGEWRL